MEHQPTADHRPENLFFNHDTYTHAHAHTYQIIFKINLASQIEYLIFQGMNNKKVHTLFTIKKD